MNELLELQKRGFYINLYFFPSGRYMVYISRWDTEDFSDRMRETIGTLDEAIAWAKERADEYEANTNKGH